MPELGRIFSVYAAGMAGGEDSRGGGGGGYSPPGSVVLFGPRIPGEGQRPLLEHSVLNAAVNCRPVAGLPFGPDHDITLSNGPHDVGIVDRISDGLVPLPAVDVGRVAWSPKDGRLPTSDENSDVCIALGFKRWNTDGDVEDQYETFNGMPVYYGGDLYDSEDSDWDDLYALASAAYVEDYSFDFPDRMYLMVHRNSRIPDSVDVRHECPMDAAPMYQTVSCATNNEWDMSDNDSCVAGLG